MCNFGEAVLTSEKRAGGLQKIGKSILISSKRVGFVSCAQFAKVAMKTTDL